MIRTIAIAVSALLLAGCGGTRFVDTYCTSYLPATYSAANDTEETKAQIRENNAVWDRLCK